MIPGPLDYARTVKKIGNNLNLEALKEDGTNLPQATVMIVIVSASTTKGVLLSEVEMKSVDDAVDMIMSLEDSRKIVYILLLYVSLNVILDNGIH